LNVTATVRQKLMPTFYSIATPTTQSRCGTPAGESIDPRNLAVRRLCGDLDVLIDDGDLGAEYLAACAAWFAALTSRERTAVTAAIAAFSVSPK